MSYQMPAPQKSTIIPIKLSGEDVWACLCTLYWQVDKCKQHWSKHQICTCSLQLCMEDIWCRNGTTSHPTSLSFWHPSPLNQCSGQYQHPSIKETILLFFDQRFGKAGKPMSEALAMETFSSMPVTTMAFTCTMVCILGGFHSSHTQVSPDSPCTPGMGEGYQGANGFYNWMCDPLIQGPPQMY